LALAQGDYAAGQALYEESQSLFHEMGSKSGIGISLINLGYAVYLQGEYVTARALYEECLALYKEMDEKQLTAYALFGLGLVDLAVNKPEARKHILHSLRLRRETGEQLYQTTSLIGAAGLFLQEGNTVFSAQLLGAVESVLKGLNAPMEPEIKPFHERTLAKVKEALVDEAFQSAFDEGSKWSLEETVKKVLEE